MMKTIRFFIYAFACVSLYACGGSDDDEVPEVPKESIKLRTQSIAQGEEVDAKVTTELKLTYNDVVAVSPSANITLNNVAVKATVGTASSMEVIVPLELEEGKDYTLSIPAGAIVGKNDPSQVVAAFTLNFKTKAAPVVDIADLVNPDATAETQKLFDYLKSIYGKQTLAGSMANVNWNFNEAELVARATGKYPAIAFFDYIHLFASAPGSWIDYSQTADVESWVAQGGMVGASWHWMVPTSESVEIDQQGNNATYEPAKTTFHARNVPVEGTWENRIAKADLEKMAGYLLLLQEKGIPVIWRPLHEAAGNTYEYNGGTAWFWWGYDGAEAYRKLWIYMFDFFKEKGINNLIWVWTTQLKDADYYPGDAYVDIIGRDIYNQTAAADNAVQFESILASYPRKMIALSECGNVARISAQWEAGTHWLFFMPWYQYDATTLVGHEHADEAWWQDAFECSFVLDREAVKTALQ